MDHSAPDKDPSIGISVRTVLPNSQELVLQSFVERDCDTSRLDSLLDRLRVAAERQMAFGGLRELRQKLKETEELAARHAARMEIADTAIKQRWDSSDRKGDIVLTAQELQQQQQSYQYAEDTRAKIEELKKTIGELEQVVGA
jgi:hypothetical protein